MRKHLPQEIKYHYIMRIFNGEKIVDIANEVMINKRTSTKTIHRAKTLVENWMDKSDFNYSIERELKSLSNDNKKRRGLDYDKLNGKRKKIHHRKPWQDNRQW